MSARSNAAAGRARSICSPGLGFPRRSQGTLPSGRPGASQPSCPRSSAGGRCSATDAPHGLRASQLHRDAPVPGRVPLSRPDPCLRRQPARLRRWRRDPGCGGGTARTARGAEAELPGVGRSSAAGAASHAPRRARSPSPRRARAAARSPARSPPPLAPRAHNEAAGREVVPAAASAPLPQPMPPPAEHLALGWAGGPGGRGLGAGARPPGGGVRTRVVSASLCGPLGLSDLPPGETSRSPSSSWGSAPPTCTPVPHISGLGLLPSAPGALRPPARPPGWSPAFPSISLPAKELPAPPLPQGGPPLQAPLGARADGRPDRPGMNSSKSYSAKPSF